jgi:polar amino acid transport system substrate-binding protein
MPEKESGPGQVLRCILLNMRAGFSRCRPVSRRKPAPRERGGDLGIVARFIAALLLHVLSASSLLAQDGAPVIRVVTRVVPPVVEEQNGALSGFSIDLWNDIAERLKFKTRYQLVPDVRALLEAVRKQEADLGVSAVSITSERQKDFDFSQPILNAGLQIMVRGTSEGVGSNPLSDLFRLFFSWTLLVWLGIALLLILVPAHLVWLLECRHENGIVPTRKYFPGIFYAMFWAAGTLATQADQMPRHWLARVIAVLWMFTGVVFVAFYTAQLTAALTVQQIYASISGPDELPGKRVATTRGSTAAVFLRDHRVQLKEFALIDQAYGALLSKEVDAVVFDSPVLQYYATHGGRGRVQVVGAAFHKEDYGIVFPPDSPLRKQVNSILLALREDGTYDQIYGKWFGGK